MTHFGRISLFLNLPIIAILACCLAYPSQVNAEELSPLAIEAQRLEERVREDTSLAETSRSELLEIIGRSTASLDRLREAALRTEDYVSQGANQEAILTQLNAEMALSEPVELSSTADSRDLQDILDVQLAKRAAAGAALQALYAQQTDLQMRTSEISDALSKPTLPKSTNIVLDSPDQNLTEQVKGFSQRVEQHQRETTLSTLQRELNSIPARKRINSARIDLLKAQVQSIEKLIATIRTKLSSTLIGRAELAVSTYAPQDPDPSSIDNRFKLAKSLLELAHDTPRVDIEIQSLRASLDYVEQSNETVQNILETGRVTNDIAALLRNLKQGLPDEDDLAEQLGVQESNHKSALLKGIAWKEELRRTTATNERTAQNSGAQITVAETDLLTNLVEANALYGERVNEQRKVLDELLSASQALFGLLERRLLWLPTSSEERDHIWANISAGLAWFFSVKNWGSALEAFLSSAAKSPLLAVIALLFPLALLYSKRWLNPLVDVISARVGNVTRDKYWVTPSVLLLGLIMALPIPLFVSTLSGILISADSTDTFPNSLANGLVAVASLLAILLLFHQMCRPHGLFSVHFGWSDAARERLRTILFGFAIWQSIAAFFFTLSISSELIELRHGLAIASFIFSGIGMSVFAFMFLHPTQGVAVNIRDDTPASASIYIGFPILVAAPLVTSLLPLLGYFDTAIELQTRFFQSGILLLIVAIVFGLLMRMFTISHRRLLLERARRRRAEIEKSRISASEAEASGEAIPTQLTTEHLDNEEINTKTSKALYIVSALIFVAGLWLIWNELVPALGIADDIVLWQNERVVDGISAINSVTLWNVLLFFFLVGVGLFTARYAPGVLEVGLFQRFDVEPGVRYAITSITGYLFIAIGLIAGFGQLGIDWSKLQWIVAALGVGLGFGLQEIVANFISGLIILFERPVRVGDTVSIGTLSGTVTNIKIRATTITDFDNRDVLLPNKSIITENVTNWTLNDSVTRVILYIGVAYGSNIGEVRNLLLNVVSNNQDVMTIPPPTVFFVAHGDSSLNFEVRIFVSTPVKRLPITHEINEAINTALRDANIEIPFPQRDLHIKPAPST